MEWLCAIGATVIAGVLLLSYLIDGVARLLDPH